MHIATILTNTHSIIKKSMPIAKDFLSVGLSIPKTFTFQSTPPCHSARSRMAKSQNPSSQEQPSLSVRGGTIVDGGRGIGKSPFSSSLIRPNRDTYSQGRSFSLAFWSSGFCNSGQALRAEWHEAAVRDWKKNPGVIDVHSWGIFETG